MERKLEITRKLERLAEEGSLDSSVAVLNLPSANLCEKRSEKIFVDGKLQQSCLGCVTQGTTSKHALEIDQVREIIYFFHENYGTDFITINGRGDPFNPRLKEETLEKIRYAKKTWGIQPYVFSAGANLDSKTCEILADNETNIMISLFGNQFIDADFFTDKKYHSMPKPMQDQAKITSNLRRLIDTYTNSPQQSEEGTTRIGMNYVVSERDLEDYGEKVSALKKAANNNGINFICNTTFTKHPENQIQKILEQTAEKYSDFNLRHSTAVNGQCQMGAGSSVTIDFDGTLLRCPYMNNQTEGDGNFYTLSEEARKEVIMKYMGDRSYPCVMRTHQR
tara:strand:- start:248 stop:1255 length:1008 start_codon:yes stop_codon:yes gene_type:complete